MKIMAEFDTETKTMKFFIDGQETKVRSFGINQYPDTPPRSVSDCDDVDDGKNYLSAHFDVKQDNVTKSTSFHYSERCGKFIDSETLNREKITRSIANLIKETKLNKLFKKA